jgi:DNA (cytosine-5)-methyltransferase 1
LKNSYVTVTDQFCGAGGSSLGATLAGAEVKLALNHWKLAIETHNTNFPQVAHDCTDISACDPRRYPSTDILLTSPECTNHSLAKGKKRKFQTQLEMFGTTTVDPAEERSRATMWDVPRFAEYHHYNLIIVENVADARHWVMFDAWLLAMDLLGYLHESVYFNSQFAWPTPQSRDRMYVVFWKKGNPAPNLKFNPKAFCQHCRKDVASVQSWKNPNKKFGKYGKGGQYVYVCPTCAQVVEPYYYAAATAIDWTLPAPRIGDRGRPLKDKTLARIELGLKRFANQPFSIGLAGSQGQQKENSLLRPMPTQTGTPVLGLVQPFLVDTGRTNAENDRSYAVADRSFPTQTSRQDKALVVPPFLINTAFTNGNGSYIYPVDGPNPTLTTRPDIGLAIPPFIAELRNNSTVRGVDEALSTVCTVGSHHALVVPESFLMSYYGKDECHSPLEPVGTVTTVDRHALVETGQNLRAEDCGFRMLQPHELGRAMAFPDSYVVLGTVRERVKQYGNAVTPPVLRMLMERCLETLN